MKSITEARNPRTKSIDSLPTLEMLKLMNDEDASLALAIRRELPQIARAVDVIADSLRAGGRLFYAGAGSSGRLGALDAAECPPTFSVPPDMVQALIAGGDVALRRSVEGAEDDADRARLDLLQRGLRDIDVVCALAASGRTPYALGALRFARSLGARAIAITCSKSAPISQIAEICIAVEVGPEVIAGSTRLKAGSAQKMILNMLSTASMIKLGKVYGNLMVDLMASNQKLRSRALDLVIQLTGCEGEDAAQLLAAANNEVKTAVVMSRLNLSGDQARARLRAAEGRLGAVIGYPDWGP